MAADGEFIVKLKGFSFDVTKKDIKDFYIELDIKEKDINLLRYPDGRSTGYAFIRLKNSNEVDLALLQDNRYMGNRYVSVTRSSLDEMTMIQSLVDQKKPIYVLRSAEGSFARSVRDRSPINYEGSTPPMLNINEGTNVVYVTGIPTRKGYKEVRRFFSGCHIQPGGVYLCCGTGDRHDGSAFVEFVNEEECTKAKNRDGYQMGDNYISVSLCGKEELMDYLAKYPKADTKSNWAGSSSHEDERKVYHSRSERRVYRNENNDQAYGKTDYQDNYEWWSDDKEMKDSYQEIEDDNSSRQRSRHRHHSKSRGGESSYNGGSYQSSDGRRVRRSSRHHSADMEDNMQGESVYSRKHYRSDSYHRSSHNRDSDLMEGSASFLDNQPASWNKLDTSLGSSTGEAEMDPLLALELLKTAGITQSSLDPKHGGLPPPPPSSSTLYNSSRSSGRSYKELDQPPPPPLSVSYYPSSSKGIVLMEGLPYETTVSNILDFFHNYNLTYENIRIQCRDDGSPSGKAFVYFLDNDTAKLAVRHLNKGYIGGRYVELKLV